MTDAEQAHERGMIDQSKWKAWYPGGCMFVGTWDDEDIYVGRFSAYFQYGPDADDFRGFDMVNLRKRAKTDDKCLRLVSLLDLIGHEFEQPKD